MGGRGQEGWDLGAGDGQVLKTLMALTGREPAGELLGGLRVGLNREEYVCLCVYIYICIYIGEFFSSR
jgi:hypothetical protein